MLSEVLVGALLAAIEITRSLPAWLRVRRRRSAEGISAVSIGVLAGTGPGWVAVAVLAHAPAAAIATVVWLGFHLLLVRQVLIVSPSARRHIVLSAVLSLLATGAVAAVGIFLHSVTAALGLAIALSSAGYSAPALWKGMVSATTAGLSLLSLAVNTLEGLVYLVAGFGLGGIAPGGRIVVGYIFFGVIATVCNFPRFVRTSSRRARGKDVSRPGGPLARSDHER